MLCRCSCSVIIVPLSMMNPIPLSLASDGSHVVRDGIHTTLGVGASFVLTWFVSSDAIVVMDVIKKKKIVTMYLVLDDVILKWIMGR